MSIPGEGGEQLNEVLEQIIEQDPSVDAAKAEYLIMLARGVYSTATEKSASKDDMLWNALPRMVTLRLSELPAVLYSDRLAKLVHDDAPIITELDKSIDTDLSKLGCWMAELVIHICWQTLVNMNEGYSSFIPKQNHAKPNIIHMRDKLEWIAKNTKPGMHRKAYGNMISVREQISTLEGQYSQYTNTCSMLGAIKYYYQQPSSGGAHITQPHLLNHIDAKLRRERHG